MGNLTIFQHLENLVTIINEFYGCDIKSKKRDFITLEARDMYINIATSLTYPSKVVGSIIGLSESAVARSKKRTLWLASNDKYFKSRHKSVMARIQCYSMA